MSPKVPVSVRAVIQRINRQLRDNDRVLKKTRGGRAVFDLGDYYVLNIRRNLVVDKHVDVERLARELEVLKDYEEIDEESGNG